MSTEDDYVSAIIAAERKRSPWPADVGLKMWLLALAVPPLYWLLWGEDEQAGMSFGIALLAGFVSWLPLFFYERRRRKTP